MRWMLLLLLSSLSFKANGICSQMVDQAIEQRLALKIDQVVRETWDSENARFSLDGLVSIKGALDEALKKSIEPTCSPCHPLEIKNGISRKSTNAMIYVLSSISKKSREFIPSWSTSKRLGLGVVMFVASTSAFAYSTFHVMEFVRLNFPTWVEPARAVIISTAGIFLPHLTYILADALGGKTRDLAGRLIQTEKKGKGIDIDPNTRAMSIHLQSKTAGIDPRIGAMFGAFNGYDSSTSPALLAARYLGESGDHEGAYNLLAGLAVNTKERQKQVDPFYESQLAQLSSTISGYAKKQGPKIYAEVLARIHFMHGQFFKKKMQNEDVENFYKPFLRALFEPKFEADAAQIDALVKAHPEWLNADWLKTSKT